MIPAKRRIALSIMAVIAAVGVAWAPVAAAPLVREAYSWEDAGAWDDCGIPLTFEAHGRGLFMLKMGRAGDPTPYLSDNYEWHWINRNPANGKWFAEDGNGLYKDARIVNVEGTLYSFEAIEVGRPYVITSMDGDRVLWDRGLLRYQFDVDTQGDSDLDNDEHLTFQLIAEHSAHPIWHQTFEEYCELVLDLVG